MKYIWEPGDIKTGRYVCRNTVERFKPSGPAVKWTFKIGFDPAKETVTLVAMTDGMVIGFDNRTKLADYLNENALIPMPHKWLVAVIDFLRDDNE